MLEALKESQKRIHERMAVTSMCLKKMPDRQKKESFQVEGRRESMQVFGYNVHTYFCVSGAEICKAQCTGRIQPSACFVSVLELRIGFPF